MERPLAVGDVCEIVSAKFAPQAIGRECTVLSIEPVRQGVRIHVPGLFGNLKTDIWFCDPHNLRRIPPKSNYDGNEISSWDLCPFNPYKARERA